MRFLFILASIVLIGGSCNSSKTEEIDNTTVQVPVEPMYAVVNGVRIPNSFQMDSTASFDKARNASISVILPSTSNEEFNQLIVDSIFYYQNDFVVDLVDFPGDDEPMKNSFAVYPKFLGDGDTLSVAMVVEQYYAGAAHPFAQYFTINYDVTNEEVLGFPEIFNIEDSSAFLDQLNERLIDSELLLQDVHYLNFTFHKDSITLFFDNYEVGPYAIGTPSVSYSKGELRSFLK